MTSVRRDFGLRRFTRAISTRAIPTSLASLKGSMGEIMAAAKAQTPVDEDQLRPSAHINATATADSLHLEAGFGGPAGIGNVGGESNKETVDYAVDQHENTEYRHVNGGNAFYLRNPWLRGRRRLLAKLTSDIVRLIRSSAR